MKLFSMQKHDRHCLLRVPFFMAWLLFLFIVGNSCSSANERKFTYTYESLVLSPGVREVEVWNTFRYGRSSFYRRLDQRIEFEFGVMDRFMSSLYLNSESKAMDSNGDAPGGENEHEQTVSFSNEWKYKLFDRVADPVGLALYGEFTLGLIETEFEGKVIMDKQIEKTLVGLNVAFEQAWGVSLVSGRTQNSSELSISITAGVSYSVTNSFSVGMEAFQQNIIQNNRITDAAIFAGPVLSYASDTWWASWTFMPQIAEIAGTSGTSLNLNEFEKVQTRLLLSFHL
jgi:hypothetical protein